MTILIRSIQTVTAVTLLFFSIGLFIEHVEFQTEITINAPKDTTFSMFTDPNLSDQWISGFIGFEQIKGQPMTKGSQWKINYKLNGKISSTLETASAIEPGKRMALELDSDALITKVEVVFESLDDKTVIRSNHRVFPKGLFWRSIYPFKKSTLQHKVQSDYQRFKNLVENG